MINYPPKQITNWSLVLLSSLLFIGCTPKREANDKTATIEEQIDIAPVWSVHRAGPPELFTRDGRQYVAYYDHDRFLTLAQRDLDSSQWQYHQFPVQMGWQTGAHAKLSLAIDRQGYIHITCYRRGLFQEPPMPPRPIYYRSLAPHSINGFEQLFMVSEDERTDYPTFITVEETLYFTFRDGGSGRGDQHFYRYDDDQRLWEQLLDTPLLDGHSEMSAIKPAENGELTQFVWNRDVEKAIVVFDEETFLPIRMETPQPIEWRQKLSIPESDFQIDPIPDLRRLGGPMLAELIPDSGESGQEGIS